MSARIKLKPGIHHFDPVFQEAMWRNGHLSFSYRDMLVRIVLRKDMSRKVSRAIVLTFGNSDEAMYWLLAEPEISDGLFYYVERVVE